MKFCPGLRLCHSCERFTKKTIHRSISKNSISIDDDDPSRCHCKVGVFYWDWIVVVFAGYSKIPDGYLEVRVNNFTQGIRLLSSNNENQVCFFLF